MTEPMLEARVAQRAQSVGHMLADQVRDQPTGVAFQFRDTADRWADLTWEETQTIAHELAAGLLALGLQREDGVAIAAATRIEWILADLAVMCAGGVVTTVYPTTGADDVNFIVDDSGVRFFIAEDASQVAKLREADPTLSRFAAVVLIDGHDEDEKVHAWADVIERGREHLAAHPDAVTRVVEDTRPEQLATLIYTSGTTGRPKGVELSHDAWTYQGASLDALQIGGKGDVQFLWLPLSHVFGKCLLAIQLQNGFTTAVDGRIDRIVDGLAEIRPTFMAGAPRIFEKVRAAVQRSASGGLKGAIMDWAFGVGRETIPYRLSGTPMPRVLGWKHRLADKLVFSTIKAKMGGRVRFFVSGSAKLNPEVQEWFYAAGILIIEGYGATETSAVATVNVPMAPRFGTVGRVMPGAQIRIADNGEVLLRGANIAHRYHNLPEESAATWTDGWYHTGDVGELTAEGDLVITDRLKDLLKTSGGKYVAPAKVSAALVANCDLISQVVVHGEGRKFVTALVTLDADALRAFGAAQGLGEDYDALVRSDAVRERVAAGVEAANGQLERWETVKNFAILPAEFTVEAGEVTPSLKVRRAVVERTHADLLDSLYPKD